MTEYFQHDMQLILDLAPHTHILLEEFGDQHASTASTYDARIVYNQKKSEHLKLTIYYKQTDHLFEKLEFLISRKINILDLLKPQHPTQVWDHPDYLDFAKSQLVNIEDSYYWEHNKKPVVLTLNNLDIILNGRHADGLFQMTENAFQHLDEYIQYGFLGGRSSDGRFIERNSNEETPFGPAKFILSLEHFYGESTRFNIGIDRVAYLNIKDDSEKLSDVEILEIGESLCLLMSFFWQKSIDFFFAQLRINDIQHYGTRELLRYSNHPIDEQENFLLKEGYNTFYDFTRAIDFNKFTANKTLLSEIVPRIIRSKNVDDISAFMILYNIIEKIRNYCLSQPIMGTAFVIKEEFEFVGSKRSIDRFIKEKIKDIKAIVAAPDLQAFDEIASQKVSFIKKTGLKDQFDSLLNYLQINPDIYHVDFQELIRLRNKIYHGDLPNVDLKSFNVQMLRMTYDMILKIIAN